MSSVRKGYMPIPTEESNNNVNDLIITIEDKNTSASPYADLLPNEIWESILPLLDNESRGRLAVTAKKIQQLINIFPVEELNAFNNVSMVNAKKSFFYVHRTKENKAKILNNKTPLLTHGQVTKFFNMQKEITRLHRRNDDIADLLALAVKCPSVSLGFLLYLTITIATVFSIPTGSLLIAFGTGLFLDKLGVKPDDNSYAVLAVFIASVIASGSTFLFKKDKIIDGIKKYTFDLANECSTEFDLFIHSKMRQLSREQGTNIKTQFLIEKNSD